MNPWYVRCVRLRQIVWVYILADTAEEAQEAARRRCEIDDPEPFSTFRAEPWYDVFSQSEHITIEGRPDGK